jgi:RiboL-PSP-HEPN
MPTALPNLKASLDKVRAIADDIDAHAADALKDPTVLARHETTLCAATVILSGFLESFLREAAGEMIADICAKGIPFDQLPSKIRITHFMEGGLYLRELAGEEKGSSPLLLAQASDAARRLASVNGNVTPYELLWEAFANTQANPGSKEIGAYLKRFHITDPIPTLGAAIGVSENTLALLINSFMEIRNECAHTGSANNVPTTSDLRSYCKLFEDIGTGIIAVFQNILAAPPYTPVALPAAHTAPGPHP